MKSTQDLKRDHITLRRIKDIAFRCSELLYDSYYVPVEDIEILCVIVEEFVDQFHHGKEEKAYFPETKDKDALSENVRKFLIEHEFGRRIAIMLRRAISNWKKSKSKAAFEGQNTNASIEPIARFLRTYAIFIEDHTGKEDIFFDQIEDRKMITEEEDIALNRMYESCKNSLGGEQKIAQLLRLIDYLESRDWMKSNV
ncbi:MAG TPA: hemerythrin domain-containing protein [Candidatus Saccharimonadales bacterium]|nr:hemerythrin domain-containing protein [Candidatus Saccharimonadales bacterium]